MNGFHNLHWKLRLKKNTKFTLANECHSSMGNGSEKLLLASTLCGSQQLLVASFKTSVFHPYFSSGISLVWVRQVLLQVYNFSSSFFLPLVS